MNIESRTNEIMNSIKSSSKGTYYKSEVLPELFALQQELVALAFNAEHADLGNLRIWDVENHLAQMNEECGGIAMEELQRFRAGCKVLCNLIKAECSGNRGESKAFYALEKIHTEHLILKNVELTGENQRTEIDAVVITDKGAFIIEVKNTHKDIFIDERGDYYRTGEYLKWDSNIGEKLNVKRELLQKALYEAGYEEIKIFEIVVFTNNRIEVKNHCSRIKTCFLGQLPYIIDEWNLEGNLTSKAIHQAGEAVENARCKEKYPLGLDTKSFKRDLATVMAKLEAASQNEAEEIPKPAVEENTKNNRILDFLSMVFSARHMKAAGTAAAIALTVVSAVVSLKNNV